MSLVSEAEAILKAAGITVKRDSKNPPFVRVDFAGQSGLDAGLRRGSITAWIVLPWSDRDLMQRSAAAVWEALDASGKFVCTGTTDQTPPPSLEFNPAQAWALMTISADSLDNWHTTS